MTLPATTPLWFRHDMGSAPLMRGVAGDAITLLDACLVSGFNSRTATSVTVTSNVATVTFSGAFGWLVNQVVEIAGATPAALNGWKRVTAVSGNTLTFAAPGVSNQTATGTISCKTPGLGWQKVFTGTNVAVYRPTDVSGTRLFLRVDDSGTASDARRARARGFETMSDVNTGTGPFPTDAQISGGLYWWKSNTADTTQRQWAMVGDPAGFFVSARAFGSGFPSEWSFGDIASFQTADAYRCLISGEVSNSGPGNGHGVLNLAQAGSYFPRASSQLGGSVQIGPFNGEQTIAIEYPNQPNSGLIVRPSVVLESNTRMRGTIRGFQRSVHGPNTNGVFALGQVLSAADGYPGLAICLDQSATSGAVLAGVFDLVGPW